MSDLSEPTLVRAPLDFLDPATFDDGVPYAELAELRASSPLVWVDEADGPGYWVAIGHGAVVEIATNPSVFSSWAKSCFPKDPLPHELPEVRQMLLNMDPPEHTSFRRIVSRVFTPRMVRDLQHSIDAHASAVIEALPAGVEFNFVTQVAAAMSLRVLSDIMGIPQSDRHLLYEWTERLVGDGDSELGGDQAGFRTALGELFRYSDEQTAAKRAHPTDDVWSLIANAEVDGERLTKDELNRFFQLLATAGHETTRTLISSGFLELCEHSTRLDQAARAPGERLPLAVEEMLRCHPPVMQFRRTATRDAEIAGHAIAAGDKILLFYPAANRDPSVFEDPDVFDITRDPNPHLSFGIGPHFCLGANLARAEARALFTALLASSPPLTVVGSPARVRSTMINGYRDIPVARI
jgi:cytochrome P450